MPHEFFMNVYLLNSFRRWREKAALPVVRQAPGTRAALLLFLTCLLCSCSSTRLTYTYLDWAIDWYVGDYLDLTGEQDAFYRERLKALLQWHRREELARYSSFIDGLEQDMRGTVSPAVLQERYSAIKQFWRHIMERAAPDCAELLLRLDGRQRHAFYAAMNKKQQEMESRYAGRTAEERTRRYGERAGKVFKRFTGSLTRDQKALIAAWAKAMLPLQDLWLENRRAWQRSLQEALEGNAPADEKQKRLRRLLVEPEHLWTPAYREAVQHNESATLQMASGVLQTLTDKQKRRFQRELDTLKKDFTLLSQE